MMIICNITKTVVQEIINTHGSWRKKLAYTWENDNSGRPHRS